MKILKKILTIKKKKKTHTQHTHPRSSPDATFEPAPPARDGRKRSLMDREFILQSKEILGSKSGSCPGSVSAGNSSISITFDPRDRKDRSG